MVSKYRNKKKSGFKLYGYNTANNEKYVYKKNVIKICILKKYEIFIYGYNIIYRK